MDTFHHFLYILVKALEVVVDGVFAVKGDKELATIQRIFNRDDLNPAHVVFIQMLTELLAQFFFLDSKGFSAASGLWRSLAARRV